MKEKLVEKKYLLTFVLITTLFALWGFANDITNPMVAAFQTVMELSATKASMVQFAFYGGYATMAIPAALFIRRYSYKKGILLGLALYAIGAFLFIPAAAYQQFSFFCLSLYILTFGLAFLETTANPYILSLGAKQTATRRLNLAQAFNPMGSLSGMAVASLIVLPQLWSDRRDAAGQIIFGTLSEAEKADIRLHDLAVIRDPYVAIGLVVVVMFIVIALCIRDDRGYEGTGVRGYENTSVSSDKANLAPSRPRTSAPSKSIRNLTDNNFDTYWATPDGVTTATLEVTFRGRQRINRLKLQEYIPLGQRVEQFAIDYLDGKNWVPLKVNEATTTIGYKRLLRFRTIETKKLRIRFEKARGALCINEMGAYYAPNALERYDDDGKMIAIGPDEAEGNAVESLPFTLTEKGTEGFLLDMGQTTFLHSLHYQPAQEGMISHYELWAGNNPDQLKKIAEGEFSNIRNNPITQDVYFATTEARYLLLRPVQMVTEGEQPKYGLLMVR